MTGILIPFFSKGSFVAIILFIFFIRLIDFDRLQNIVIFVECGKYYLQDFKGAGRHKDHLYFSIYLSYFFV